MNTKRIEELLAFHNAEVRSLVNQMNDIETAIFASTSRADKAILVANREVVGARLTAQAKAVAHYEQELEKRGKKCSSE